MKEKIGFILYAWVVGLPLGIFFLFLIITKRVEIKGYSWEKLKPPKLFMPNHCSLWEPVFMPFLFFPWFLFNPRFIPISAVDKTNYYTKRWFSFFRKASLAIDRDNPREGIKTMDKMIETLNIKRRPLILYAESGRTYKGKEFKISSSGSGRKIRRFPRGLRRLFSGVSVPVLPIWVEGGDKVVPNTDTFPNFFSLFYSFLVRIWWHKVIIKIGEPVSLENIPEDKAIEILENILLELGDRE